MSYFRLKSASWVSTVGGGIAGAIGGRTLTTNQANKNRNTIGGAFLGAALGSNSLKVAKSQAGSVVNKGKSILDETVPEITPAFKKGELKGLDIFNEKGFN